MEKITMNFMNKKIGIWGFGVVGKSLVDFLHTKGCKLEAFDKRVCSDQERVDLHAKKIIYTQQTETADIHAFLNRNDFVIPSPGIDIRPFYTRYKDKWLAEVDIFMFSFQKFIVGVTGSVGKTTIINALSDILFRYEKKVAVGGNIGTGMLDLIKQKNKIECALLELSSFQLTYAKNFASDLAIITHFSENHLDWHGSMQHYFDAKCTIFKQQNKSQAVLLPFCLLLKIRRQHNIPSTVYTFSTQKPTDTLLRKLHPDDILFFIDNGTITKYAYGKKTALIKLNLLPKTMFDQNWLILCSALEILGLPLNQLPEKAKNICPPEHRLEQCAYINNIMFYNDSKATTPAATLAAVNKLHKKPVILFLGGLSKGVDRKPFIAALRNKVKKIYCFGKEADYLHNTCTKNAIPSYSFATLEDAVFTCLKQSVSGDYILFSPAGSSFDLFDNYAHRGRRFKELINDGKK